MTNPKVFMDLSLNKKPPKRIVITLFANLVPKTAENFRALCTGEMGIGKTTGKPLHYKGTAFHHFCGRLAIEGGDISNRDGTGGESIYGGNFPAERNPSVGSEPGIFMTLNRGFPKGTGSLFYICLTQSVLLQGGTAAFGRIVKGIDIVSEIAKLAPAGLVEITDCGAVPDEEPSSSLLDDTQVAVMRKNWYQQQLSKEANHQQPSSDTTHKVIRHLKNQSRKKGSSNSEVKNNSSIDEELLLDSQEWNAKAIERWGDVNVQGLNAAIVKRSLELQEQDAMRSGDWPLVAAVILVGAVLPLVAAVILVGVVFFRP